ncbi:MAG: glycosyl transferase family 2 [Zunongwangia sp.]|uniref:glycosyltransferase n=1 Tax=Zunongwangia profunda TaxID=398743 RepID=UPI000C3DDF6C|nr:glycosyltransferase [Zunongwangia profunda]MAC63388.1 glycosyl transferase family 2 [Flavobacteriaceae bacterium]MAO38220.1 glycosyl transferase family 2 [Zunongwangia sp.]MAS69566.1 glycosyl transferase family 2 [Zunongwangia sp.]|tara:strand:- start:1209 stop:1994 length:786 start_codon:yes stop_codon:yes gene_type:complete
MISVVIRNKNEAKDLEFLLFNLTNRYSHAIDEIIVVDNESTDGSERVTKKFNARFETIKNFSYGGSANFAAEKAKGDIVVIFSAHSYPVSPEFFDVIKEKFDTNKKLAGVRCLHAPNDYRNYILSIDAENDPNKSGLIFTGSAFRKKVWEKIPFNDKVPTFEDKDWTKRVLKKGYQIEFAPVIFAYEVSRTKAQAYFRRKNDLLGNYQIWHMEIKVRQAFNNVVATFLNGSKRLFIDVYYAIKFFFFVLEFKKKKPEKFEY